jgi:integrase
MVGTALAKSTQPDALVFSTWSGKPISPNNVLRHHVFPACEGLGLKRVTWLTLRRTYSSWAHDKGVPGKVVAQLMGHTKVDTTLNVYTQVIDSAANGGRQGRIRIVHYCSQSGKGRGAKSLCPS